MSIARVYAKGQITLPKTVRDALDVSPGDSVVIEERNGEAVIRKPRGILEADGLGTPKKRVSWKEARKVAREERVQRYTRK